MKTFILILLYVLSINIVNSQYRTSSSTKIIEEIKLRKQILNQVDTLLKEINFARSNPKNYSLIKNLQFERLDTLLSKEPFLLEYELCKKAQSYSNKLSKDTYNLNYVICQHSDMNYNESICFSISLSKTIYQLILDKGSDIKGHRKHLLSIDNKDTKIGIGISYIPNLEWYIIVIVTE